MKLFYGISNAEMNANLKGEMKFELKCCFIDYYMCEKRRVPKKYGTLSEGYLSKMISCSLIYSAGDLSLSFLKERKNDVRELKPHCSDRKVKVYLEADLSYTRRMNSSTRYWLI